MPQGAALGVLEAVGPQGQLVVVMVLCGLFVLATFGLQQRRDHLRDKQVAAQLVALGKSHELAMGGALRLLESVTGAYMDKTVHVVGLVDQTVARVLADRALEQAASTKALTRSSVVIERILPVLERIAPSGANGSSARTS